MNSDIFFKKVTFATFCKMEFYYVSRMWHLKFFNDFNGGEKLKI